MNLLKNTDIIIQHITGPLTPLLLIFTRIWVAWAFFTSGMLKYNSWDSTLYLFQYEYQVPLLPWKIAAYTSTAVELILPVFLILGLFTRPAAMGLFVFNIIAVLSYPLLWEKGFIDHQLWGIMMLVNLFWGSGMISIDYLVGCRSKRVVPIKNSSL